MDITLENYKLIKLEKDNKKDVEFVKNLFLDEDVLLYLGHLENDFSNVYIVSDIMGNYIGYLSMSNVVLNMKNLTSVTLYYAIDKKYRGMSHGTLLLSEVSDYLLDKVDMLVMMIDINNKASRRVAERVSFNEELVSDEEIIYTKYSMKKRKQK